MVAILFYLFFQFYFSIKVDTQYYFILVSGLQHSIVVKQLYNLGSNPPDNSSTPLTQFIVITTLTVFPILYFMSL